MRQTEQSKERNLRIRQDNTEVSRKERKTPIERQKELQKKVNERRKERQKERNKWKVNE